MNISIISLVVRRFFVLSYKQVSNTLKHNGDTFKYVFIKLCLLSIIMIFLTACSNKELKSHCDGNDYRSEKRNEILEVINKDYANGVIKNTMREDMSFRPIRMTSVYKDFCIVKITYLKNNLKGARIEADYYTNVEQYIQDNINEGLKNKFYDSQVLLKEAFNNK